MAKEQQKRGKDKVPFLLERLFFSRFISHFKRRMYYGNQ